MKLQLPKNVPSTTTEIFARFEREMLDFLSVWKIKLAENPALLYHAETEVRKTMIFFEGCLLMVLLSNPMVIEAGQREGKIIRRERKMRPGNMVSRTVQFLCGFIISVHSLYAAPAKSSRVGRPRGIGRREKEGSGLYPELASFGIHEGISPALRDEITRQAILLPSFDLAKKELGRQNVHLGGKKLFRVVHETGGFITALRCGWIMSWRNCAMPVGTELEGKRVGVAVDGGRSRIREYAPQGRKTKTGRRKYKTPWREPKALIIFVLDDKGRMDSSFSPFIDVTMEGPDALMELLAMHLYRLGATKAMSGIFLGDGAEWIWNRTPWVIEKTGLNTQSWHQAVDFYHVMEHVSAALEAVFGKNKAVKGRIRGRLKKKLKNGQVDMLVSYLEKLASKSSEVKGHIAYIREREKLMRYEFLIKNRFPIGSGAIESAIRRVINQRLKAPGSFWKLEHVGPMAYMRAQVLTGRWEEMMSQMQNIAKYERRRSVKIDQTPPCGKHSDCLLSPSNSEVKRVAA